MITVRFFGGAREAAGTPSQTIDAATADDLERALTAQFGDRMGRILNVSSLLCDGRRVTGDDPIPPHTAVDVLPPFAGG